jgi:iron complex transport system substrate-binding protein
VARVVTLAPFLTELVFAAGGGDRLVGVSEHSDYPPAATRLQRVAGAASIDFETILALQPDLVLLWRSGNGPMVHKRLSQFGLTVYSVEPREPRDIVRTLRTLGQLFGTVEQTAAVVERFENTLQQLRDRYSQLREVSVFYQIAERPLMTLNGAHIVSAAIRLCGGRNVFASIQTLAPTVSRESVVSHQPQVILLNSTIPQAERIRKAWLDVGATLAARGGHVYQVDASLLTRPTPRFAQGVAQLCELIDRARN